MKTNTDILIQKLQNVYEQFRAHKLLKKPVTSKDAHRILKDAGGENKRGLGSHYWTLLRKHNIIVRHGVKDYKWMLDVVQLPQIAEKLFIENYQYYYNSNRGRQGKMSRKNQDTVQPVLITESVMREQDRQIVTANDQIIQRIKALETIIKTHDNSAAIDNLREEMNKTFVSILKRIGEESIKLDDLKDKHHKQRNGLIKFIDKSMIALNSLLETL